MRAAIAVAGFLLAGCAPKAYLHDNPTVNVTADMSQCEYEIEMNASGVKVPWWYNNKQAGAYLIGAAIGSAIRNDRLRTLCMQAKGYRVVVADGVPVPSGQPAANLIGVTPIPTQYVQPPPTAAVVPVVAVATPAVIRTGAAPAVAGMKGESKWMYQAEGIAKSEGCIPPMAAMTSKGAGMEMFAIACPNGTTLAIRCEIEGCRTLR